MKLPFSKPSTPAPEGAHPARLVRLIDVGTQASPFTHDDGSPVVNRKLNLAWELYCDRMPDGRPFMVSAKYTRSLNEKGNLFKMLQSWLGKEWDDAIRSGGFDFSSLLGRPCLVTVNHGTSKTGSVFAKLGAVTVLPKGLKPDEQVNPNVLFDLDKPDWAVLETLPQWQQEEIGKSPEFMAFKAHPGDEDQDVPF